MPENVPTKQQPQPLLLDRQPPLDNKVGEARARVGPRHPPRNRSSGPPHTC